MAATVAAMAVAVREVVTAVAEKAAATVVEAMEAGKTWVVTLVG